MFASFFEAEGIEPRGKAALQSKAADVATPVTA